MSLTKCPECGKEVSTQAAACPNCGAPRRARSSISPWTLIGWVIVLVLASWLVNGFIRGYRDGVAAAGYDPSSVAPSSASTAHEVECQASDIFVRDVKGRNERHATYIVGRIDNRCGAPVGAQIKFTVYDRAGSVLSSQDLWPASINNIPAHGNYPFEVQLDPQPGAVKFDTMVVAVKHWK